MSVRDYAILWSGAGKAGSGGGTALGGNALLTTAQHKLDGIEHLAADDTTRLDASVDAHGLMPKLSGDASEFLHGGGAFAVPDHGGLTGLGDDDHPQYLTQTEADALYAPTAADYLVGTAQGGLSAEIVVGTTPGGELGGTWASPTVDPTHSGSAHHAQDHASRHVSGGADSVKLDDLAAPDDNTDLNASTSAHGLLPKLGGGSTNFLRADGTWNAPGGGGTGLSVPIVIQSGQVVDGAAQNPTLTLGSTPTVGHRLILFTCSLSRSPTSVTQTNVTWTQITIQSFSTTIYSAIWVGVVGSSPGSVITVNHGSGSYTQLVVAEVADALTPALGAVAAAASANISLAASVAGPITPAPGTFVAAMVTENDGTIALLIESNLVGYTIVQHQGSAAIACMIGYAQGGQLGVWTPLGSANADHVSIIASIT